MHPVTLLSATIASKIAVLVTFLILFSVDLATPVVPPVKEIPTTVHLVVSHCTGRERSVLLIVLPVINRHRRPLFVL